MVVIRLAVPEDAESLAYVHVSSWKAAYKGLVPESYLRSLNVDKRAELLRAELRDGHQQTYLMEMGSETVGLLTIGPCRDEDIDPGQGGEIWRIYLLPHVWRLGLGSKTMTFAEE